MPSVTPERHPDRNRRRRNKSESSRSNSPVSTKRSSKHENSSRKDKEYSRDNSKRDAKNERSDGKKHRHAEENRHRRSYRSRSRSKSRERVKDRAGTSHQSSNSHRRSSNRDHEKSKTDFSRVVVKEEPVSDDEGRRRRHINRRPHDEVKVKKEGGSTDQTSREDRENIKEESPQLPKEKPNFEVSGKLAEDTNVFNGYVIKYNEPAEAKKPAKRWRLYVFKGEQSLPMIEIHRQSAYLLGRVRKIADIPIDHPSCSKQHAVLQYRAVQYTRDDGTLGRRVRPYIIDLESANGTFVNNQKIEPKKYVELLEKDVLKFGFSSREYVLLHEGSTEDEYEDDNVELAEVDDSIIETKEEIKQE